ncbi:putative ankyrin repeat protein [Planoprotostelium fungivorum]|uniref:Putative ankyrin repeat protein n=1 Tax=Planoprotostelium fungivorum TaxID=1890364 RepID=A0A2P6NV55_9EUKA|nr:putative ankyrin repeat protein [Planoprotostelium fungivorum]
MSNGIISNQDVTRVILQRFAILRLTCKLWKGIVDSLTDWLINDDLLLAVRGRVESLRLLLAHDSRVDPSAHDNYAIRWSAKKGHNETVDIQLLLTDSRVNPSVQDNYAIRSASNEDNEAIRGAANEGHREAIQLLLTDPPVDPSAQDNEAIIRAARKGHTEVLRLLMSDSRVDPSAQDNEAIRGAAIEGHRQVIQLLLTDPPVDPSIDSNIARLLSSDPCVDATERPPKIVRLERLL